jgi:hypothetical protein
MSPWRTLRVAAVQVESRNGEARSNSDGNVVASLGDVEWVAVGDVTLDPARKLRPPAPNGSYWARPPRGFRRVLGAFFVARERLGIRAYERSASRRVAARNVGLAESEGWDTAERHPGLGLEG